MLLSAPMSPDPNLESSGAGFVLLQEEFVNRDWNKQPQQQTNAKIFIKVSTKVFLKSVVIMNKQTNKYTNIPNIPTYPISKYTNHQNFIAINTKVFIMNKETNK